MRCSNSAARLPAKTRCVCASTNPGVTHLPPASITTAWGGMSGSSLTYGAAASTRPSSISSAASWINPSSRNSAPTRGRGGPAKVTNCPMLTIAMVIEVSRVGDPTSRTVSEPADLAKQRSILRIQRPAREHFLLDLVSFNLLVWNVPSRGSSRIVLDFNCVFNHFLSH